MAAGFLIIVLGLIMLWLAITGRLAVFWKGVSSAFTASKEEKAG